MLEKIKISDFRSKLLITRLNTLPVVAKKVSQNLSARMCALKYRLSFPRGKLETHNSTLIVKKKH